MQLIREWHAHAISLVAITWFPPITVRIDKEIIESYAKDQNDTNGQYISHPKGLLFATSLLSFFGSLLGHIFYFSFPLSPFLSSPIHGEELWKEEWTIPIVLKRLPANYRKSL
jgi:ABC-type phosphate/phosphonate transport system permease subunit